jgi:acetyl esterase/lipase
VLTAISVVLIAAATESPVQPLLAAEPTNTSAAKSAAKEADRPSEDAVLSKLTVAKLDVPYGLDEKQRLDVYSPQGTNGAPVVVFVHRGEWSKGDKSGVSYKPKFLNEQGIVLVSVNYRLSPAATHPAHINDVAAAVRWVYDHAEQFGGDPAKIVLLGHSCGCHLVTLLALDPRYLAGVKLRPSDLRGVVAWSGGAYDLVQKVQEGGMYSGYIKSAFGDSPDTWRDASPVAHVGDAQAKPPFLFISVEAGNASHQAAEHLAALICQSHGRADSKLIEGRDHFTANHLLGAPDDTTGKILVEFVRSAAQ